MPSWVLSRHRMYVFTRSHSCVIASDRNGWLIHCCVVVLSQFHSLRDCTSGWCATFDILQFFHFCRFQIQHSCTPKMSWCPSLIYSHPYNFRAFCQVSSIWNASYRWLFEECLRDRNYLNDVFHFSCRKNAKQRKPSVTSDVSMKQKLETYRWPLKS